MRVFFGILVGIALAVGAAYVHDNNIPGEQPSAEIAERPIVNWDVLSAVMRQQTETVRRLWKDATGL